jgi:hypothetical protein
VRLKLVVIPVKAGKQDMLNLSVQTGEVTTAVTQDLCINGGTFGRCILIIRWERENKTLSAALLFRPFPVLTIQLPKICLTGMLLSSRRFYKRLFPRILGLVSP